MTFRPVCSRSIRGVNLPFPPGRDYHRRALRTMTRESGRGQPHSKTLRAFREPRESPTGLGVRLPSAAFRLAVIVTDSFNRTPAKRLGLRCKGPCLAVAGPDQECDDTR